MSEKHSQIYRFGEFRLDAAKRLFYGRDNKLIALTPKVFDTLLYLVRNDRRVIEKDELMSEIWADSVVEENNLNKNISILRRALGEAKNEHRFIVTIPGRGYKFVAEVREVLELPSVTVNVSGLNEFENLASESNIESELQKDGEAEIRNLNTEIHRDANPTSGNKKTNRLAFIVLAIFIIFSVAAAGFYLRRGNRKTVNAPIKTIAVLPFKPLVRENRSEAFELGMADALINKISASEEIIVRPLGSVRRFNELEQDVLQAGRELGADSVLEGTIQTSDDRIRIAARLVSTGDGKQLWTETFDEKFTDIFAVQDSISQKVLSALTLKLTGKAQKRLTKRDTENVEAYQLYMKGRFHTARLILPEAAKGVEYYNQALALDPNYALCYVGIAQAYVAFALSGDVAANDAMPKAKAAAVRAVELDGDLPESHVAAGFLAFWYDWDWSEAEKKYRRALELDPNNAAAHFFYAHLNSNLGRHAEALAMVDRARQLDPLSLITNSAEGQFLFFAGRSDEAVSKLNQTLDLDHTFWHSHLVLSAVYAEKRMFPDAVAEAEKAARFSSGNSQAVAVKAYALAKSGDSAAARIVLAELQQLSTTRHVPAYNFAIIHNALGETETALDYLERAFAEKNALMVFLKVELKWNNLRGEQRFVELMKRMNFE